MCNTRLAHNIVRDHLPLVARDGRELVPRYSEIVRRIVLPHLVTRTVCARDMRRLGQRKVLPALKSKGFIATLIDVDGNPCVRGMVTAVDDRGLFAVRLTLNLTTGAGEAISVAAVTTHAMARFLQRTNSTDFFAMFNTAKAALAVACTLREAFVETECKQVAVPAGDGVFVGVIDREMIQLSTWFIPEANGRASPWRSVRTYFGMQLRRLDKLSERELLNEACETAQRMITTPTIADCFPFLQDEHTYSEDHMDTTWKLARAQEAELALAA